MSAIGAVGSHTSLAFTALQPTQAKATQAKATQATTTQATTTAAVDSDGDHDGDTGHGAGEATERKSSGGVNVLA